jgi:hypothetical protein
MFKVVFMSEDMEEENGIDGGGLFTEFMIIAIK